MMSLIVAGLGAAAVFLAPGLALVSIVRPARLAMADRIGLACGAGLCVYPILLEWLSVWRIPAGSWLVWGTTGLSVVGLAWRLRRRVINWPSALRRFGGQGTSRAWATRLFVLAATVLLVTRMTTVAEMVAPAWGDGVHHTFIVQLLLDHGGLFESWAPYAQIDSFSYHFGFHANAAAWAWVSGMPAPASVLVTGQVCNVLAVLALFPLASHLSGNRWAGPATIVIAGFLSTLPAFFVNWGRYTHLAGLAVLPGLFWCFDQWWTRRKPASTRVLAFAGLLASGLFVMHYRLAVVGAAGALAWAIWGLMCRPAERKDWAHRTLLMAGAGVGAALLHGPWLMRIAGGRYADVMGTFDPTLQETFDWGDLASWHVAPLLPMTLGGLAAVVACWRRPRIVVPVMLWLSLSFVITNPFLVGLPGTGWIMNDMLVYSMYVPIALAIGWAAGEATTWMTRRLAGPVLACIIGAAALTIGVVNHRTIADPFYQMVRPSDLVAFDWIRRNVPEHAVFLVNGFIREDYFVVGSDAGWWLPFYTRRRNTVPPALYHTERLSPSVRRAAYARLVETLRTSGDGAQRLRSILADYGITHVFLGERRGGVGYNMSELIPEDRLRSAGLQLAFQSGLAQVWSVSAPLATAGSSKD